MVKTIVVCMTFLNIMHDIPFMHGSNLISDLPRVMAHVSSWRDKYSRDHMKCVHTYVVMYTPTTTSNKGDQMSRMSNLSQYYHCQLRKGTAHITRISVLQKKTRICPNIEIFSMKIA